MSAAAAARRARAAAAVLDTCKADRGGRRRAAIACRASMRCSPPQRSRRAPAKTCCDEVAYWLYSSGTTGMPKGVMHVHSSPMVMARAAGQEPHRHARGRRGLFGRKAVLRLRHRQRDDLPDVGRRDLGAAIRSGRRRKTVFEMLRGYQPTMFFAVPTLYAAMLAESELHARARLAAAAAVLLGGRAVAGAHRRGLEGAFRPRHRQRRRLDRDGTSVPHQPAGCGRVRQRPACR